MSPSSIWQWIEPRKKPTYDDLTLKSLRLPKIVTSHWTLTLTRFRNWARKKQQGCSFNRKSLQFLKMTSSPMIPNHSPKQADEPSREPRELTFFPKNEPLSLRYRTQRLQFPRYSLAPHLFILTQTNRWARPWATWAHLPCAESESWRGW